MGKFWKVEGLVEKHSSVRASDEGRQLWEDLPERVKARWAEEREIGKWRWRARRGLTLESGQGSWRWSALAGRGSDHMLRPHPPPRTISWAYWDMDQALRQHQPVSSRGTGCGCVWSWAGCQGLRFPLWMKRSTFFMKESETNLRWVPSVTPVISETELTGSSSE